MALDILSANDTGGQYPDSWYAASAEALPPQPPLRGEQRVDVAVIGAGYTGLSAALQLRERGYRVALLDAHRVGWGASGRNGGQLGSGQRVDQRQLERQLGRAHARALWALAEEAKALVTGLLARHAIDAQYRPGVIHAELRAGAVADGYALVDHLRRDYAYEALEALDRRQIGEQLGTAIYHGGVLDRGAGHLHPLRYALGLGRAALAAGVAVHEGSRVQRIVAGQPLRLETEHGALIADFAVLGCNGYLGHLQPRVAARVMPINNFIIATEPLGERRARELIRDDVAVADSKFVINYYRCSADHRLLFGGDESYGYRFPADIAARVRRHMLSVYPQLADARIEHAWGGTLGITVNRLPHLERIGPNLLSAAGFSGHGVAMATLAGQLCAEAIAGTAERFDALAAVPTWPFPGGRWLRTPLLALAMSWYALRDRL